MYVIMILHDMAVLWLALFSIVKMGAAYVCIRNHNLDFRRNCDLCGI